VRGALLTERVIRDATDYPTTARELRERECGDGSDAAAAAATDGATDAASAAAAADPAAVAAEEAALAAALTARRAAVQREAGNEAFRAGDWASAAVAYTSSLSAAPSDAGVLCNRAAAFLKLGRHEQALADARAASALEPGHVKAHFRAGLALHALRRFPEAGAALSAAAAADPRNAQIRDALRMTEVALAREAREAAER
jgi:tetratricopeptide (TPR) repeat protein